MVPGEGSVEVKDPSTALRMTGVSVEPKTYGLLSGDGPICGVKGSLCLRKYLRGHAEQ